MVIGLSSLGKKLRSLAGERPLQGVIGIDFGSSSIKVVQLKQEEDSVVLETYGELQLGPYAGVEMGRATNLEASRLSEALRDILTEASVSSRNAGTAVPYASSFVTVLSLPVPNDAATLGTVIPIEARKYVPVPISQVTLDWFVIPPTKGAAPQEDTTKVLLAAIHNEAMSKSRTVLSDAGVANSFHEIEIFSTIRSSIEHPSETVLVADIGAGTTKLYIVSQGLVQATHSLNVGGQDMTSGLAQALELTISEAEEMKRQVGLTSTDNPRIGRALSFALERIATDARRMVEAYERTQGAAPVSSIVLAGGGSALRGIEEYLEEILGRTVRAAHPFSKVVYPAFLETTLKEIGPSFSVAMGVALRRLQEG